MSHIETQAEEEQNPSLSVTMAEASSAPSQKKVTIDDEPQKIPKAPHSESHTTSSLKGKLTIQTCCGVVELTSIKLACMIAMFITIIALSALAAMAIYSFVTSSNQNINILVYYGSAKSNSEASQSVVIRAAYMREANVTYLSEQYATKWTTLQIAMNSIISIIGTPTLLTLVNSTATKSVSTLNLMNKQILAMAKVGNYTGASAILESDTYAYNKLLWEGAIDAILFYVQRLQTTINSNDLASSIAQLIIIGSSLFTVLPILIVVMVYAINRDSINLEKIRKASAIMLMDTMEDDNLRNLFRLQCEQEKSLENFLLLDKIQYYRSLCEKSLDLVGSMHVADNTSDSTSDTSGQSGKRKEKIENELKETENKKYEVAFEIFTDFMDQQGEKSVNISSQLTESVKQTLDNFNNKNIISLPEKMFNVLENEICIVLMDAHHRFKQSLAFQREMKIDKIKVENLKKKKRRDF